MENDNPFNDLLHRAENYDIELLEYTSLRKGDITGWDGEGDGRCGSAILGIKSHESKRADGGGGGW